MMKSKEHIKLILF